ncbi:hypothetical protein B0T25DRAFT_590131 [Lasiosphaeria hispida]|uniref:VWFA domain-containing protein n=1 Tax=Lasiosphaeria hispida TaxID=260671 RepID=A0AAJ0HP00_9PEZI|nr:hypothetical protein B0T25DRAFT_590131 [Lasiosphaeria hispida]
MAWAVLSAAQSKHLRRADPPTCDILEQIDTGSGGRKVGIVIDASNSMEYNDPENLRLEAAHRLNIELVRASTAVGGQSPDLVSVVQFNDSADLLYPLGDPSGASASILGIVPKGGTFIGRGVQTATDDLTKPGSGLTAGRTAIVVLTDGVDDPSSRVGTTISEIRRASDLGIRISFGFLSVDATDQDPDIVSTVVASGGTFSILSDPDSIRRFVAQVFLKGLTATGLAGPTRLLPGITVAATLPQTGASTFLYAARAGEALNVSVRVTGGLSLRVVLRDARTDVDLASAVTGDASIAVAQYTAPSAMDITILVTATGASTQDIFYVAVESSVNLCDTSTTPTPTPTLTPTPGSPPLTPTTSYRHGGSSTHCK